MALPLFKGKLRSITFVILPEYETRRASLPRLALRWYTGRALRAKDVRELTINTRPRKWRNVEIRALLADGSREVRFERVPESKLTKVGCVFTA